MAWFDPRLSNTSGARLYLSRFGRCLTWLVVARLKEARFGPLVSKLWSGRLEGMWKGGQDGGRARGAGSA